MIARPSLLVLFAISVVNPLAAQDAASRAFEHALASHEKSLYFTIPPRTEAKKHPLLVVLPGGPGTRDFLPWVENGILGAAPDDCVGVMVTAVKWTDEQKIVWPTAQAKVEGMKYTTEDYVAAVVKAVGKEHPVDNKRVALLAWSSSGPAAYRLTTARRSPFTHGYIAMSVWRPLDKRDLRGAKKRRFVLEQSPDDQVTTFSHVRRAFAALDEAGAEVTLSTYAGGHGWKEAPIPRLRRNLAWLFGKGRAPKPEWPDQGGAAIDPEGNLLRNAGFEEGAKGWRAIDNSGRFSVAVDDGEKVMGKQALQLSKTGAMPLDLLMQEVKLPAGESVTFAIHARTKGVKNAWIKVWLYDAKDQVVGKDVNVARLNGSAGWKRYAKTWPRGEAVRAVVQVVMVLGGEVWLDEAQLTVGG